MIEWRDYLTSDPAVSHGHSICLNWRHGAMVSMIWRPCRWTMTTTGA